MAITDWPAAERPRERLLTQGSGVLSDAELLAIFLRVGIRGSSAVDLARQLLDVFDGSLARLSQANATTLAALPGMGPAKSAQLVAVLELARRALADEIRCGEFLSSPQAVRDWLRLKLAALPHEVFCALWLDSQNRLIGFEELFRGTLTRTSVYPREVVKRALACNASAAVFAHNHPSGIAEPSSADEILTRSLRQALTLVDIKLLDHFIVAGHASPVSFAERGLL